jgi:DNA-binding phage protein
MAHGYRIIRVARKPRTCLVSRRDAWIATRLSGKLVRVTDPVTAARAALDRAEKAVKVKREALVDRIVEAVEAGEMLSKVADRAGYEREHVRRLVRARGVEPRQLRTPPPVRSRTTG